jgi:hypothetical protein
MCGGKTNEPILNSNISKGHGHQSSPSHPPTPQQGRRGMRHDKRERNTLKLHPLRDTVLLTSHTWTVDQHPGHGADCERKVTNRLSVCGRLLTAPRASASHPSHHHAHSPAYCLVPKEVGTPPKSGNTESCEFLQKSLELQPKQTNKVLEPYRPTFQQGGTA